MPVLRVVLDTNVVVSALLGKGKPARLYEAFKQGHFSLILSNRSMAELADVLLRPEFDISPTDVKDLFRLLRHQAFIIRPAHRIDACRDPKDNFVLECALSGDAEWIVTGDRDLLVLIPFRGIHIVTPALFLKHLRIG
jgi:putative PIN family toxin of toxin-antitoxin system